MLRFVFFLFGALVLSQVLGHVPLIGGLFRHTGILGVWIAALLLSWSLTWLGQRAVHVQRDRSELRRLEAVDSPHNRGKMGTLLLAQGRFGKALPLLEEAARGEPEVAEWAYRAGCALLSRRRSDEAVGALERAVALDEEYAYGAAQLRLAEARLLRSDAPGALEALAVFERNHGPGPESAFRRGQALKAVGRRDEARAAFDEVDGLASRVARYQRGEAQRWQRKAWIARFF